MEIGLTLSPTKIFPGDLLEDTIKGKCAMTDVWKNKGPEEDLSHVANGLKHAAKIKRENPDDGENWPEIDVPGRFTFTLRHICPGSRLTCWTGMRRQTDARTL